MMSNDEHHKLWSAYLDGQLSASEAARFDESLSQQQREQLACEMQFESAVAEVLGNDAACPDDVWRRTVAQIEGAPRHRVYPMRKWLPAVVGIAAAVVMVVAAVVIPRNSTPPFFLTLNTDEPDFAVPDGDLGKAQRFLDDRGVAVALRAFDAEGLKGHEGTRILGLREARYGQEPVYELYYECCGKPMKIALAPKGGAAAAMMDKNFSDPNGIQLTREVGEFRAALVGKHHATALLNHIEPGTVQKS
jgi:hypothetical protein